MGMTIYGNGDCCANCGSGGMITVSKFIAYRSAIWACNSTCAINFYSRMANNNQGGNNNGQ